MLKSFIIFLAYLLGIYLLYYLHTQVLENQLQDSGLISVIYIGQLVLSFLAIRWMILALGALFWLHSKKEFSKGQTEWLMGAMFILPLVWVVLYENQIKKLIDWEVQNNYVLVQAHLSKAKEVMVKAESGRGASDKQMPAKKFTLSFNYQGKTHTDEVTMDASYNLLADAIQLKVSKRFPFYYELDFEKWKRSGKLLEEKKSKYGIYDTINLIETTPSLDEYMEKAKNDSLKNKPK